jgi:hypothetical protein
LVSPSSIIFDYGYTTDQIHSSLEAITSFLSQPAMTSLSDSDLIISQFAINHFNNQPLAIQLSIQNIKNLLSEKPLLQINLNKDGDNASQLMLSINDIFKNATNFKREDIVIDPDWEIVKIVDAKDLTPLDSSALKPVSETVSLEKMTDTITSPEITKIIDDFYIYEPSPTVGKEELLHFTNNQKIKQKQKEIIAALGHALFYDYLPDFTVSLKNQFIETLRDSQLSQKLSSLTERKDSSSDSSPKADEQLINSTYQKSTLLQRSLFTQAKKCLQGICETLSEVLNSAEVKNEFPEVVYLWIPEHIKKHMSSEVQELLDFLIKFYLPEILEAILKSLQNLLEDDDQKQNLGKYLTKFLSNFETEVKVDIVELVAYVIHNNIPGPAEAGAEVFIKKMKNESLNVDLMRLLNRVLVDLFFVEPGPLHPTCKHVLISIITNLNEFFSLINKASHTMASLSNDKPPLPMTDPNKILKIAEMILQDLCSKGKIQDKFKTTNAGLLDQNIREVIENLLWILLFPKKNPALPETSISLKIVLMILSAYLQKICSSIFTSETFNILIEKLMTDSISLNNPFEYDMPSHQLFGAGDKQFSSQLDENIRSMLSVIIRLGITNDVSKTLVLEIVKLIPTLGDEIQQKLNKACNSPVAMLPIILATQLFYKVTITQESDKKFSLKTYQNQRQKEQNQFFDSLEKEKRNPSFKKIFNENESAFSERVKSIEGQIFGKESQKIITLIKTFTPWYMQALVQPIVIDIFRNFYALLREDLILKELLFFFLDGLKAGLLKANQEST